MRNWSKRGTKIYNTVSVQAQTKKKGTVRSDEPPARHEPHKHNIHNEQLAVKKQHIQEHADANERTYERITYANTNMQKRMHTHAYKHTYTRTSKKKRTKKCNTQSQAQARTDDRRVMEASPEVVYADVATQARTGDRKVMGASPVVLSADVVICCATPT